MNKAIKGAIAAGAAGILLLGGAGTFAVWSDTATVDAGMVSTGQLSLSVAAGSWAEATHGPIADIGTFQIIPGDSLTYNTTVTVKAEGENLHAELTVPTVLVAPVTNDLGATVAEQDLAVAMVIDSESVDGIEVEGNSVSFDAATTYTIPVTITVDFTDVAVNIDQNLNIDLESALTFSLEQTA
ncbi:alternate signal-mediated exported protein [Arthrobacter pascens]|uniref:alternate-type signal peptide domain-containing protein n=1 Tax=Arthrobacter pascens TaxID=1677 RepID=UPI00278CE7E1|nr:alternate-type signal peptide domain-containing protein [Arthrobacter pascens]MDQ0677546.1 alternate signal-mediated exported protein [Arthrobacter pascens]